jgi:hypothetical protein
MCTGLRGRWWKSSWGCALDSPLSMLCVNPSFTIGINICNSNCCSWRGRGGWGGPRRTRGVLAMRGNTSSQGSLGIWRRRVWQAEIIISLGKPQRRCFFLWLGHEIMKPNDQKKSLWECKKQEKKMLHKKMEDVNNSGFSTSCNRELLSLTSHFTENYWELFLSWELFLFLFFLSNVSIV